MANALSSAWFHVPTPPARTPHMGSAAVNRPGSSWSKPAVMIPPSEWPQAIVRLGGATSAPNVSRVSIWS